MVPDVKCRPALPSGKRKKYPSFILIPKRFSQGEGLTLHSVIFMHRHMIKAEGININDREPTVLTY